MLRDILGHHDIIQFPRGILPAWSGGHVALGPILPKPAIQRIPPNLEDVTGHLFFSTRPDIGDHSLSKIDAIGIAHTSRIAS
jgi:hypothetical protein